jgi:hypothetical protein
LHPTINQQPIVSQLAVNEKQTQSPNLSYSLLFVLSDMAAATNMRLLSGLSFPLP